MSRFSADATLRFLPFTRQIDGEEAIIGRPELGVFLCIPLEALELLDQLAAGKTIGEVQAEHQRRTGEVADMESLLGYLDQRGFVDRGGAADAVAAPPPLRFHFADIPQSFARKVFGRPALIGAFAVIALAVALAVAEPSLRPSWRFLLFEQHVTLMNALLMVAGLVVTLIHEMGHLCAARARGVSCRLGIGNRLWVLVAETDMTGIWSLPSRERYLPILAGPLTDALSGSTIVLVLFAHLHGWLTLPALLHQFLQAMTVVYVLNLVWQCYFFVRTDLYYVYTTAFGCKNLLGDTRDYLRNRLARLRKKPQPVDQRHISAREMRAIGFYSGFYLIGRVVALSVFFVMMLPLTLQYVTTIYEKVFSSPERGTYQYLDAAAFGILSVGLLLVGIFMWCKELYRNWRSQRVVADGNSPLRA